MTGTNGATATASASYTIVPPLPAPTGLMIGEVHHNQVGVNWVAVEGAGSQSPVVREHGWDGSDSYLFRYRAADADATAAYKYVGPLRDRGTFVRPDPLDADGEPITTGDYLGMAAAIRHTIEQKTPAALNWSAPIPFGVARAPQNIVVQASHDTVDVSWDEQPYARSTGVSLVGDGLRLSRCCVGYDITSTDGRYHARFRHLTPATEYEIEIEAGSGVPRDSVYSMTTVRTLPAPADWEPLPEGPQNLRATATHDSITLYWDLPFSEAPGRWYVRVSIIIDGIEWVVQRKTTQAPPPEGVTLRGDLPWQIRPNATYHVLVRHDGFDASVAEISVTTPAAPPAGAQGSARAPFASGSATRAFVPDWPVAVTEDYYVTDDPFDWRGDRYHAGLDIGSVDFGAEISGDVVVASAGGTLRVFNDVWPQGGGVTPANVLYCPGLVGAFHTQFITSAAGEETRGGKPCYHLVTAYSGRTALVFHPTSSTGGYVTKYAHLSTLDSEIRKELGGGENTPADPDATTTVSRGTRSARWARRVFVEVYPVYRLGKKLYHLPRQAGYADARAHGPSNAPWTSGARQRSSTRTCTTRFGDSTTTTILPATTGTARRWGALAPNRTRGPRGSTASTPRTANFQRCWTPKISSGRYRRR